MARRAKKWDAMTAQEKFDTAVGLLDSMRGKLIMGQALAYAIIAMRSVKAPYAELSNMADMKMLGEALFEPWFSMYLSEALPGKVKEEA